VASDQWRSGALGEFVGGELPCEQVGGPPQAARDRGFAAMVAGTAASTCSPIRRSPRAATSAADLPRQARTDDRRRLGQRISGAANGAGLIIPTMDGDEWKRQDGQNWRRRVYRPSAVAAGVTGDLRPYRLRSSFVSLLLWEGRSLAYVAEQAGHSIAALAKHYAGVIRELESRPRKPAGEAIAEAREAVFSPGNTGQVRAPTSHRKMLCATNVRPLLLRAGGGRLRGAGSTC
jgi:hypothetical protein